MVFLKARMAATLAERITVYSHGNEELTAQLRNEFEGKPLMIEPRKIGSVEQKDHSTMTIRFEDGESTEEGFLVCLISIISVTQTGLTSDKGLCTPSQTERFFP